jgi:hypothetical protein
MINLEPIDGEYYWVHVKWENRWRIGLCYHDPFSCSDENSAVFTTLSLGNLGDTTDYDFDELDCVIVHIPKPSEEVENV